MPKRGGIAKETKGASKGVAQPTLVKLKRGKTSLEILCKPATVEAYRKNPDGTKWPAILETDVIFTDYRKSKLAKDEDLEAVCGSTDPEVVFPYILQKGTFAYSTEELAAKREQRKRWIIHHLHSAFVNPTNDLPYSPALLETLFDKLRLTIDPLVPPEVLFDKFQRKFLDALPLKPLDRDVLGKKEPRVPDSRKKKLLKESRAKKKGKRK